MFYTEDNLLDNMAESYEEIVGHCLKSGDLWEDADFPALQSSLFYHQTTDPKTKFEWKRPHVRIFPSSFFKNVTTDSLIFLQ